jgi:hypothetical protein
MAVIFVVLQRLLLRLPAPLEAAQRGFLQGR